MFVDDNYCYMDEDRRWKLGEFETYQEAVAAAKKVVDDCLVEHYKPGTTAAVLYMGYKEFGDDPLITGEGPGIDSESFTAWEYAKLRCEELCNPDLQTDTDNNHG